MTLGVSMITSEKMSKMRASRPPAATMPQPTQNMNHCGPAVSAYPPTTKPMRITVTASHDLALPAWLPWCALSAIGPFYRMTRPGERSGRLLRCSLVALRHVSVAVSATGTAYHGSGGVCACPRLQKTCEELHKVPAILDKILRAGEGKTLRKLKRIAEQVNSIEEDFQSLSDAELRALTDDYKSRHADGESLDDLLPEAFATVREAARRVLGQRHFDVQLMGGAALHLGNIAEMRTGEGKTLTCTLPAYLNAISGRGVHVITVNDYLAKRDADTMGRIHRFLGLEVGVIMAEMQPDERRKAYA